MIRTLRPIPPRPPTIPEPALDTDSPTEMLWQVLHGFLPPTTALFHFFDRMEQSR